MGPEVNGEVDGVAFDGASVYAGGWFESAGGVAGAPGGLRRYDGLLDWNRVPRQRLRLEFVDSLLIATGAFDTVDTAPRATSPCSPRRY